jgi:hypothetical protein
MEMDYEDDVLTDEEWAREQEQRIIDAESVALSAEREEQALLANSRARLIQEELQLLADNPQLRRRLRRGHVSTALPYADSRRPTDPNDTSRRHVMDYAGRNSDRDRNYAAGLL